ncbi:MAG: DUF2391 family protein [Opitutales bacterium]
MSNADDPPPMPRKNPPQIPGGALGKASLKRINGILQSVTPLVDEAGRVVQWAVSPVMVEFKLKDLLQILVGSSLLAVPVAFTEETWNLGERLPLANVLLLGFISLLIIGAFVYYTFYRVGFRQHFFEYLKRVIAIYGVSLLMVGCILTIILQCPWETDPILAIKRIILVGYPASMSAAVTDSIK